MIYTWILVRKKDKAIVNYHRQEEKPLIGNNGKEKKTSSIYEWLAWGKELPEDIDEKEYFYKDGELS